MEWIVYEVTNLYSYTHGNKTLIFAIIGEKQKHVSLVAIISSNNLYKGQNINGDVL